MINIANYTEEVFEKIKHIDEEGNEYWFARELMVALDYNEYRFFVPVINKSISLCLKNKRPITDHFVHVHDMVTIGSKARRKVENYKLSRYA